MLGLPEIFTYMPDDEVDEVLELEACREFLTSMAEQSREPDRTEYKLGIAVDGQLIGIGGLDTHGSRHRCAEIGYMLHPDHWGKGFATEAAALLLTFGFDTLGLHRIEATTRPDNTASHHVLEKIGMTQEGVRRQDV